MKMKIVINECHGGFSLSEKALGMMNKAKGYNPGDSDYINPESGRYEGTRYDKDLVEIVEKLGKDASGEYSNLGVIIVDDPRYVINEYDGLETIMTPGGIEWEIADTKETRDVYPELFL